RDRAGADAEDDDRGEEEEKTAGGECAQEAQGDPFWGGSPFVVPTELETTLRAGSSIVNCDPSANARPPCSSPRPGTLARPSPQPDPARPRQKRSNARSASYG